MCSWAAEAGEGGAAASLAPSLVLCGHNSAICAILQVDAVRALSVCRSGWACSWDITSGRCLARFRGPCWPISAAAAVLGTSLVCFAAQRSTGGTALAVVDAASGAQVASAPLASAHPLAEAAEPAQFGPCDSPSPRDAPLALHVSASRSGAAVALGVTREGTLLVWHLLRVPSAALPKREAAPGVASATGPAALRPLHEALQGSLVSAAFSACGTWLLCCGARAWALLRCVDAERCPAGLQFDLASSGRPSEGEDLAGAQLLSPAACSGAGSGMELSQRPGVLLWAASGSTWADLARGDPEPAQHIAPALAPGSCIAVVQTGPGALARVRPPVGRVTAAALAGGDALAPALLATVRLESTPRNAWATFYALHVFGLLQGPGMNCCAIAGVAPHACLGSHPAYSPHSRREGCAVWSCRGRRCCDT